MVNTNKSIGFHFQHLGVVTAAASLIEALVKRNTVEYKGCVSLAVSRLSRVNLRFCSLLRLVFSQRT